MPKSGSRIFLTKMVIFCRLTENVKHFDQKCQITLREIVVILQREPTGSVDGSVVGFADIVSYNRHNI